MKIYQLFPILVLLVTGCETTQTALETPSGNPEIVFETEDINAVKSAILQVYLQDGWTPESTNGNQMQFIVRNHSMLAIASYGTKYDSSVYSRDKIFLSPYGGQIVAQGFQFIVNNKNSPYEGEHQLDGNGLTKLQGRLMLAKSRVFGSDN